MQDIPSLPDLFSSFSGRLKWAREKSGLTQTQLSALVAMTQGAYSKLERGGEGSIRTTSIARVLNVDPYWLETGNGTPSLNGDDPTSFVAVRAASLHLSAGIAGFEIDYIDGEAPPLYFRKDWILSSGYNPSKLICHKVKGRSMETTLYDGDTVVVNLADTEPRDGRVYAINFDGEPVIKRMIRDESRWWLNSDNEDKSRFPRKAATDLSLIVGRIIARQSTVI